MPPELIAATAEFVESFLPAVTSFPPQPVQTELPFGKTHLIWHQVGPTEDLPSVCARAVLEQLEQLEDLGISELVFLASSNETGLAVAKLLQAEDKDMKVRHTFAGNGKRAFYKGDARVKGTTINSFKGWESRAVVLHIGKNWRQTARAGVYAGLTRLRQSPRGSILTVVCEQRDLARFGRDHFTPGRKL